MVAMMTNRDRERTIKGVTKCGLALNLALAAMKFFSGIATGSVSVISDAINNTTDCLSSIVTLVGYNISRKRPTRRHPFGYGRSEYLSALTVAYIVLLAGIECLISSIKRIASPTPVNVTGLSLAMLIVSLFGKIFLYFLNTKSGKSVNSEALKASGEDALSDILSSLVIIIAVVCQQFTAHPIDGIAGIVISLFIFHSGITSMERTNSAIIGESPDKGMIERIKGIIEKHPPLSGGYDFLIHSYGPDRIIGSCNIEVPLEASAEEIFDAMTDAKEEILNTLGIVFSFGMFAVNDNLPEVRELKRQVLSCMQRHESHIVNIHAFHVHFDRKLVHFDAVLSDAGSHSYGLLKLYLKEVLEQEFPGYSFEFTIDLEW